MAKDFAIPAITPADTGVETSAIDDALLESGGTDGEAVVAGLLSGWDLHVVGEAGAAGMTEISLLYYIVDRLLYAPREAHRPASRRENLHEKTAARRLKVKGAELTVQR